MDNVHIFADDSQCIHFLNTSVTQGKVYVIVSESFGEQVVSCIHDQSVVDTILIFQDSNRRRSLRWINKWSKIQGVFNELSTMCATLKKITRQDDISISTFSTTVYDPTTKIWNREEPSMVYTQILKETLLSIDFQEEHKEDSMKCCTEIFSDNKFEWNYRSKTPIWWYLWNSFPYRLLNSGLREMNIDLIIRMGFFINDLHQHIQQLYSEQFGEGKCIESFTVYHGRKLSKADFDRITKNKNDLISFNSFLSTSKDYQFTLRLAQNFITDSNFVAVFFVVTINPNQPTTPFASTAEISENQDEDEILFSINPVFRVEEVKLLDRHKRLYQINVTLAAHDDSAFCQLTHHITRETCADHNPWHRLGSLLITLGEYYNAEKIYQNLLNSVIDDREKGYVSNARGWLRYNQGKYKEALKLYKASLVLYKKVLPSDHRDLAIVYNNMGIVCNLLEDYSTALFAHKTALKIRQLLYESNYPALYMSYSNLGDLYQNMGDHTESLMYFEKGLEIIRKILPDNDPDIAALLVNIGKIYYELDNYEKALLFQKSALKIWRQSPLFHPYSLAACYGHIGLIYKAMNNPRQALLAYNKSLSIVKRINSSNHTMLADLNYNAGLLYYRMGKYPKAYTLFQNAVNIGRQSLSAKHSYLRDYRKYLKLAKRHL
ncbi:unnamed protein product [Adineta ricciae]|uniref:Uncharacterized protein n=1 Tax=Adineta ricciae TaxID=249248 RepID=A0A815UAR8_ADIRI|nr:unnamed protein product [Adineta ricciae]CAF1519935.1 unnamed protein product [Adineta ricciae]